MKWSIGIDPGLTETGMVLCQESPKMEQTLVEWRTFSCPPNDEDLTRVVSLASTAVETVIEWVEEYGIERLDVSIEMPVYTHNAASYTKQIRLLEEIESGLFYTVTGLVNEMHLTEVFPTTSKSLLTGSSRADKDRMVSEFEKMSGVVLEARRETKEAVADAYAHSLACWILRNKVHRLNLTNLQAAIVNERGRGHG